jgi:hypothetical protein
VLRNLLDEVPVERPRDVPADPRLAWRAAAETLLDRIAALAPRIDRTRPAR